MTWRILNAMPCCELVRGTSQPTSFVGCDSRCGAKDEHVFLIIVEGQPRAFGFHHLLGAGQQGIEQFILFHAGAQGKIAHDHL